MASEKWVCRHKLTLVEDCQDCLDDDSEYNRYPNGWHYITEEESSGGE